MDDQERFANEVIADLTVFRVAFQTFLQRLTATTPGALDDLRRRTMAALVSLDTSAETQWPERVRQLTMMRCEEFFDEMKRSAGPDKTH